MKKLRIDAHFQPSNTKYIFHITRGGSMSLLEKTTTRRYINLPTRTSPLPFSDGVLVGNTLYLAGRIGIDPVTGQAPQDVDAEIQLLLDGVQAVLAEAGMKMDDLVSVQIFSPDLSLWDRFNSAYMKRFSQGLPARAFIGSGPLLLGGRFEMVGIAMKD
jgi:enamine deaminase RidA (YjgF/YER057c/UK114 family)